MQKLLKECLENISGIIKKILKPLLDFIEKYKEKKAKEWKLHLYYLKQHVATVIVQKDDQTFRKVYVCNICDKEHIFRAKDVTVVLLPQSVLYVDELNKEIHVDSVLYEGEKIL